MKTLLLMTLTLSTTLSKAEAQELVGPTEQDLITVSISLMDDAESIMSKNPGKDCDNDATVGMSAESRSVSALSAESRELFCVCELDGLKGLKVPGKEKNLGVILGDYVSSEATLATGNDNILLGGLQAMGGAKYDTGTDRGRSADLRVNYSLTGTEGELKLSLDSTLFGKFSPQNGYNKSPDGRTYLNGRERNTLLLRLDKNFSYGETSKTYLISEFKLSNETDEGNLSRAAQEKWHRAARDLGIFNAIQYNYVKEQESEYAMSAVMGVGKKWVTDLGNWKCQTALEAKGGMSVSLNGSVSPEASVYASSKVSHSSMPWLALSAWIQGSAGFQGKAVEGGLTLSAEKKVGNVIVRPFIGVEQHRTKIDRKFSSEGRENALYHVLGVTIKY